MASRNEDSKVPTIFAIEEPEAFLHPDLQSEVWNSLTSLSGQEKTQVIITSHSSNLIERTDVLQVRYLREGEVHAVQSLEDEGDAIGFVQEVQRSLGRFRDSEVDYFLLVEGKNDIVSLE